MHQLTNYMFQACYCKGFAHQPLGSELVQREND
jgi:hypothetical protein